MRWAVIGAVALVCIGVIGLGVVESRRGRRAAPSAAGVRPTINTQNPGWRICLPVAYCLLDAAGTFADSLRSCATLDEDSAELRRMS